MAALLPARARTTSWSDLSQGVDQARADLRDGLAAGPLATHYFGHGGEDFWADEHLFDAGEAASLGNEGRETLLFAWTCVSQNYLFGMGPSVGEAMLLAPAGGALATVRPHRHHRRPGPGGSLRAALSAPPARSLRWARPCAGPRWRRSVSIRPREAWWRAGASWAIPR